jgi:hypothetical protein
MDFLVIFMTLALFMENMIVISDRRIFFEEKTLEWDCIEPGTVSCQKVTHFQLSFIPIEELLQNTILA